MEKFKKCVSVMSWFSQVIKATNTKFVVDGGVAVVRSVGVPSPKVMDKYTFTRIAEKWGKLLDVDDQDETCFHSKRLCVYLKAGNSIREDFKITHRGDEGRQNDEFNEVVGSRWGVYLRYDKSWDIVIGNSKLKESLLIWKNSMVHSGGKEDFAQILDIPCAGACVFTDRWSLDELAYGVPLEGPYQTSLPSPDDTISYIREDREGQVTRILHKEEIKVQDYQILTREIVSTLKPLEEIIQKNVFCLGGNRDHVPACLCYMLYYVANFEKFNLAYYIVERMEWVTKQSRLILNYGILLTRLFKFIMNENPELFNESYVLYDRVMNPLAAQQERKTRKDFGMRRGRHSTSSSSAFDQPSSSHLNNNDDGNDEGTSRASTPSPIHYVNLLTNEVLKFLSLLNSNYFDL
ncbi:hypothetical protein Tco_1204126 [Tanacetum coccineum]